MFRLCFIVFVFLCTARTSAAVDADYATLVQGASFGTILQTSPTTTAVLATNGTVTVTGGTLLGSGQQAIVNYSIGSGALWHNVSFSHFETFYHELDGCSVVLNNTIAQPSDFSLGNIFGSRDEDVSFGATLTITGFCKGGNYSASYLTQPYADLGYNVNSIMIPVSVTIAEKLGISAKQDINFGAMMSPSSDGTVTLSYNGQRSATGGIYLMNNADVSQGIFTIDGTAGRTVYVSLPSEVFIYSGGNSLSVNNFTASTGTQFTLASDMADMHIGATLNVPANAPEGDYSGTYTVTVSY